MARSPIEILTEIAAVLEQLGIRYALGGSLASSLVGEPRSTVDIDLAVHLDHDQLDRLLANLVGSYYVPTAAAAVAVDKHSAFNLIHKAEAVKVDLFVLGDGSWTPTTRFCSFRRPAPLRLRKLLPFPDTFPAKVSPELHPELPKL